MVVPTSVDAQFRRLKKYLRELEHIGNDCAAEDEAIIVADICNSCVLALDKSMNAIWKVEARIKDGKGKANVYFPISMSSREKLLERLRKDQMPDIEKDNPRAFALIESVQAYKGGAWLTTLHAIAKLRHETFPEVKRVRRNGLGIGMGQDLYIDSLHIGADGKIDFKGHGINRSTGKIEPAKFDLISEVRSELADLNETPYRFCSKAVDKVTQLVSNLYRSIPSA